MKSLKYPSPMSMMSAGIKSNKSHINNNNNNNGNKNKISTAPWWIAQPSKAQTLAEQRKQSLSASFGHDVAELFRNIGLHGYEKIIAPDFNIWEKLIWLLVHVTMLFTLLTVLTLAWEQFAAQYVTVNLHDPLYSLEKVPFPAVAICTNNRISRHEALLYAERLSGRDPHKRPVEFFLERISDLSSMYYKYEAKYNYDALTQFQSYLDVYGTWENETFFNTRRVLTRLTPKCDNIILKCLLAGKEIKCFSKKAFQDSLTIYGPCCTFNLYNSYKRRTFKDRFLSVDLGLTVVLNTSSSDNFASVLNSDGYIVILHTPSKFPDFSSGAAREVFPTRGKESFISIRARVVDTVPELRVLGPRSRKCYFDDEAPDQDLIIQNTYSFANCITRCRIRSILALCNCVPFYMPLDLVNRTDGIVYCTLQHVVCLNRYNYKWRNVLTEREVVAGLERAVQEALFCPLCLPGCYDVQYDVSLQSLPMDRYQENIEAVANSLPNNETLNITDFSVLRVHFGDPHALYYRRMVGNSWFEAFSTVGNICSIFVGFSLVVIFEIGYVIIKNLFNILIRLVEQSKRERHHGNAKRNTQKLYILP